MNPLHATTRRLLSQRSMLIGMLSGLVVLGGACGWFLRDQIVQRDAEMLRERSYLQTLLIARRTFLNDPPSKLPVSPGDLGPLATRIDRRFAATIRLPDNGERMFTFRGGRLLPLADGLAALLILERDHGRVSLIVARDALDGTQAALNRRVQDTTVSLAEENGFQLGIVGRVASDEFNLVKRMVEEHGGI